MSQIATSIACAAALVLAACVSRPAHPHGMPPGQAKKLAHAHGAGCGHEQIDGVWVSVTVGTQPGRGPRK